MSINGYQRAAVLAVATGAALLLGTGAASAHVSAKILGEAAEQGSYSKITFRVPNEDDAAGTVKLEVKLPADAPMSSVRPKPIPGWTAQVVKSTLAEPIDSHGTEITEAASSVTWTANRGTRIAPGEFGEFELAVGPLPEVDQLVLPAIQTYEGGKVVAWDEETPEGGEEPERPAPVIALSPASEDGGHDAAPAANEQPADGEVADTTDTAAAADGSDDTARWLGGAGLVVGALGLGFGVGATLRARRSGGDQS
ncbi:nuclear export factor GLE1 [Actinophytocola xinjiangensis]|uniref:Nuclear export factor GLE1 n=1 Tax=Actinophytocola xinjiangensis TaxID=485602 RepID=A0A7Z0WFZ1_9PSEU|nr:YcnI family protein [Actinophytocola xinjiangensis]OLF06320.1 nuclear export factor GLE1 [Actinophytocola xinjiangensis]